MAETSTRCPACDQADLERFLRIDGVPVVITEVFGDRAAALAAPRGDLDLASCPRCGLVRNLAFDASLVEYTPAYENSQLFSPTFREYAQALARRLVDSYDLVGGVAVEIGSGKGEFLEILVEEGLGEGVGFDPTYDGEVGTSPAASKLRFVRELFDVRHSDEAADLVCCRHVLEHVDDPAALLSGLRRTLDGRRVPVYFEVPRAEYVFGPHGLWDLIYQHVSYFTGPALRSAFTTAGFEVTRLEPEFGDQFFGLDAVPSESPSAPDARGEGSHAGWIETFAETWAEQTGRWADAAARIEDRGGDTVLWGAGAKGATFLNLTPAGSAVTAAVDVNPRKRGAYVPGTGQPIVGPDDLAGRNVSAVIIANPAYEAEIRGTLADLGVDAEISLL